MTDSDIIGANYRVPVDTKGVWRVGEAANPLPSDKVFELLNDALAHARLATKRNWSLPIAVWDKDDGIDYLFMCGEVFRRT